jgi:16S rRNA processing protein RimM
MNDNYISVGILKKPHGLSGAFNFTLTRELRSLTKAPTHFFVESNGSFIPYFITKIDMKDIFTGWIGLEGITNPEQARPLVNSDLYLDAKSISTFFKKSADEYGFLIGYIACDGDRELGRITEIVSHPAQTLAAVDMAGSEVLIPLVDELITDIDRRRKKIVFALPEGLV